MDLSFSDEQRLLQDSAERLLRQTCSLARRRQVTASPPGFDRELWRRFADMGWLGLPFAEACGGLGGGPVEVMILMEAFGRSLVVEPYLATVMLAGGLIEALGAPALAASEIRAIAAGDRLLALAHVEPGARYALSHVAATAARSGKGFVLNGQKTLALNGDSADRLIVSARTAGAVGERAGISLFLIDADTPGLARRGYATVDAMRAADIVLDKVKVGADALLGKAGEGFAAIEAAVERALAALCAEAVGIMDALTRATIDYLKTRRQFGTPLSTFQALQHRAVDMYIATEQARSLALKAALALSGPASARAEAVAAAQVHIGRAGRHVGQEAVQLHGGMGMTDELIVGQYFKRLTAIEILFGNADHHLSTLADGIKAPP